MSDRICSVEGCENPVHARGWCGKHYDRWQDHGSLDHAPAYLTACSVEGCDRPHMARGWCGPHYRRWRKSGEAPTGVLRARRRSIAPPGEALEFLRQALLLAMPEACQVDWPYGRSEGRPVVTLDNGLFARAAPTILILSGRERPAPPNHHALHSCDDGACYNHFHLRWGSHQDNMRDRDERGRGAIPKLSDDKVAEVRRLLAEGGPHGFQRKIADRFGVSQSLVSRIKNGTYPG